MEERNPLYHLLHLREIALFAERRFQKKPGSSSVNSVLSPLTGEGQGESGFRLFFRWERFQVLRPLQGKVVMNA